MYNSLSALPKSLYKIMEYLALSSDAEDLWKMLKYNGYDALSHKNLSFKEKMKLVWAPKTHTPQDGYSVFFTNLIEDAVCESKCVLKLYDYMVQPTELYKSVVVYAFDFLYGGQMSLVEYEGVPVNRGDLFLNIILSVLNGANIGGVGNLSFSDDLSRYCGGKAVIGNSKTFTGVCVYLATQMGDTGKETLCGR